MAPYSPDVKNQFGKRPRFESDDEFLPLQAADFLAWWVREWYEKDEAFFTFPHWTGKKPVVGIEMTMGESALTEQLVELVRLKLGPSTTIMDRNTGLPL